ncbi:MAG: MotE family protein [Bacillota bacterium]|nr:MotE family protein [Bacillota bacterium]
MDNELEAKQTKKGKSIQWFIFVVLIPLLFTVIVALIICFIAGVNVFGIAKDIGQKIPFIENSSQNNASNQKSASESDLINLQAQIKDREAQIEELKTNLDSKDKDIEQAKLDNQRLQQQIDDLNANKKASNLAFKDIIKTYETMSPKKVAPIITKMDDTEAIKILGDLKADALAAIMENMNPKDAAKYTQLLSNETATK